MKKTAEILVCAFILSTGALGIAEANYYCLPDTGQTKCYDNEKEITCPRPGQPFYGQDAQYHGPHLSYLDNGDGTVTDRNTWLVWQQGESHNQSSRTWQQACDYCDALTLGGRSDWRLPDRGELASLPHYGVFGPSIDTVYFPDCRSSEYWSKSTCAGLPDDAWTVHFSNGYTGKYPKTQYHYVRCVCGEATAHAGFTDNGDDTVTDTIAGLTWQQNDDQNDGGGFSWEEALEYCECLNQGGKENWRLPNVRELESLSQVEQSNPAIDPIFDSRSSFYWSSTTFPFYMDSAWCVYFADGTVDYYSKENKFYVRCVHGGLGDIDGGYNVTSGLWAKAILQVAGNPVTLIWQEVGRDITPVGAQVISGYFYADPNDFAYGSRYNPEVFVKIYIAANGWCNIAFNHVTVDDVTVYSAHNYSGTHDKTGTVSLTSRLAEHQYDGVGIDTGSGSRERLTLLAATETGGGYIINSGLWEKAVLQTPGGPVTLKWKDVGADNTPTGARVVSGYFYADPADFAYGSEYNPELFVKIYIDPNGWANIASNHVTVDNVDISSSHNYDGTPDQSGTASLGNRLVEHQYTGVTIK